MPVSPDKHRVVQTIVAHRLFTGENAIHADPIRLNYSSHSNINASAICGAEKRSAVHKTGVSLYSVPQNLPRSLVS